MAFFKNLFKETGVRDVITLFHAPQNQASARIYTLLKQTAATSQTSATEDQASDHTTRSEISRSEFDLDVQENPPTPEQLSSILDFLGPSKAGSVVEGATGSTDALRKFKQNDKLFQRPVVVDWNHGRAVAGENTSEILNMIKTLPKETDIK